MTQLKTIKMTEKEMTAIHVGTEVLEDLGTILEDGEEIKIYDMYYSKEFVERTLAFMHDLCIDDNIEILRG